MAVSPRPRSQPAVASSRTPIAEWGERLGLPILLALIVLFALRSRFRR